MGAANEDLSAEVSASEATLAQFYRETWFTVEGARLKKRRLDARGIPSLKNWRFLTLTIEDRTCSPLTAYLRGKDRLRRFTAEWRECLGREIRWFWKLELHEDGYPHWHMLLDYLSKIPREFMDVVNSWWGLGRVNIKRVSAKSFVYLFKYVCKGGETVPDWVLDYPGQIRCTQASSNFFTKKTPRRATMGEPKLCLLPITLRRNFLWDQSKGLLTQHTETGKKRVSVLRLEKPFAEMFSEHLTVAIRERRPMASASALSLSRHHVGILKNEHRQKCGSRRLERYESTSSDGCCAISSRPYFARYGHLARGPSEGLGGEDDASD